MSYVIVAILSFLASGLAAFFGVKQEKEKTKQANRHLEEIKSGYDVTLTEKTKQIENQQKEIDRLAADSKAKAKFIKDATDETAEAKALDAGFKEEATASEKPATKKRTSKKKVKEETETPSE